MVSLMAESINEFLVACITAMGLIIVLAFEGAVLYVFIGYLFGIGPLVESNTVKTCTKCMVLEMHSVHESRRYGTAQVATGVNGLPKYLR